MLVIAYSGFHVVILTHPQPLTMNNRHTSILVTGAEVCIYGFFYVYRVSSSEEGVQCNKGDVC